jgi:hypothetical protein
MAATPLRRPDSRRGDRRELSPGSILDIPDVPLLTEAQLDTVTRTDVPTKIATEAGLLASWLQQSNRSG